MYIQGLRIISYTTYCGQRTLSLHQTTAGRELLLCSITRLAPSASRIDTDEVCADRPKPGGAVVVDRRSLELRRARHTDRVRRGVEPSGEPGGCRADRL